MKLMSFYDRYHQKNDFYSKIISDNNFTYFYIQQFFKEPLLQQTARQLKILDVGCGVGTISLYLGRRGFTVDGLDISERAIHIAQKAALTNRLKKVTFQRGELKKGHYQYDVVVCFEVIEHIKDDGHFAELLRSHLKKDGWLILSTPSKDNLLFRLGFYRGFDREVGHLRRYTPSSIARLLKKHGFKVKTVRTVEGPLRNLLFTTKLGFVIRFIRGPLIPLFHWLDQLSATIAGAADIQVLAQRS